MSPTATGPRSQTRRPWGYFANLLPVSLPYDPDKIFHEALAEAKEQMRSALLHGAVLYGALIDHLGLPPPSSKDPHSHAPLFQAVFDYKQGQAESGNIGDAKIVDSRTPRAGSPYDITLEMTDDPTKAPPDHSEAAEGEIRAAGRGGGHGRLSLDPQYLLEESGAPGRGRKTESRCQGRGYEA